MDEVERKRKSERKSQSTWMTFKAKDVGINRCRRKCGGIARRGRESVCVCVCACV